MLIMRKNFRDNYHNHLGDVAHSFARLGPKPIVHTHVGFDGSTVNTIGNEKSRLIKLFLYFAV